MDQFIGAMIATAGPVGMAVALLVTLCAIADAVLPVPRPGSRWVAVRLVVSAIAINRGNAENRVLPGTIEAATTLGDVLTRVIENHESAEASRALIKAAILPMPGKIADLTNRVNNVAQLTVASRT